MAAWPCTPAALPMAAYRRRCSGGRWLGRACARGAARRGKGGGARGCGHGGMERQGRGGSKLGQPTMADARLGAERSEEEQVRESAGEWGARRPSLYRAGEAGHAARKLGNGGHVHGHAASFEAFYRARGGRRYDRRGEPIWATSGLNQTLGQKRSFLTSDCSTFLI